MWTVIREEALVVVEEENAAVKKEDEEARAWAGVLAEREVQRGPRISDGREEMDEDEDERMEGGMVNGEGGEGEEQEEVQRLTAAAADGVVESS